VIKGDPEETVRRFMAAINSDGDLDDLNEICLPPLAEEWRANMEDFAFTERTFTVDDVVADGSKVAILWSIAGRHTGEFAGIPPTGKRTSDTGAAFFTLHEGKIAKLVTHYDAEGLFKQLGATITPPA
jgi:steroid delta-isomerase-like uncharacterized protein